jgi:hypothetical protein
MHDPAIPPPRPVHPFAYNPGTSLPFSALAGQGEDGPIALLENERAPSRRPESEMLSRGAGVRYLSKPAAVPGGREEDVESRESAGMGTFGREVEEPVRSKAAVSSTLYTVVRFRANLPQTHRTVAPQKASPARSRAPPTQPLPATPAKSTATTRKPVPPVDLSSEVGIDQVNDAPHVRYPHHEHPFTLADAANKPSRGSRLWPESEPISLVGWTVFIWAVTRRPMRLVSKDLVRRMIPPQAALPSGTSSTAMGTPYPASARILFECHSASPLAPRYLGR